MINILTVVSLVLCLATVALWVRSYFDVDSARFGGDYGVAVMHQRGKVWMIMASGHVAVPHWAIAGALAMLPLFLIPARWKERRRRHRGLCTTCGYDLRATPNQCPECGSVNDSS